MIPRDIPFEGCEDGSGCARSADSPMLVATVVTKQSSHRDPTGKPEDHSKDFHAKNTKLVCGIGEASRRDDQVGEGKDCPHGTEEEIVCLARRP